MPKVTMPQLGEGVAEGTIGRWLKQVGDVVAEGDAIVEVITDKVNAEVPSPYAGTLTEILVEEGAIVPNDAPIATIEAAGAAEASTDSAPVAQAVASDDSEPADQAPAPDPAAEASGDAGAAPSSADAAATPAAASPAATPEAARSSSDTAAALVASYTGRLTPSVRRLAREHQIDLNQIQGSGIGGRITRDDLLQAVEARQTGGAASAGAGASGQSAARPGASAPVAVPPAAEHDELQPLTPMRRAIAAQMVRSKFNAPHASSTVEVDMSQLVQFRDSVKEDYRAREGIALSYVPFVTKAVVESLRRHPDLNAHWTEEGLLRRRDVNIGIAVAVEGGLVVPVIHHADGLSIHGLNQAIVDLASRARSNRLRLEDIQGGTFTVNNTGSYGSVASQPIVNVPEIVILTMEAIVKRPVVIETPTGDVIGIRPMMNLGVSFDHRATDGAQVGRFVQDVRRWLESVDSQLSIW